MYMGSPRLAIRRALLKPRHATLISDLQVPSAATVFCQPIQLRCSNALGFNVEQANRWRWRPDYEGVELACNRSPPAFPGVAWLQQHPKPLAKAGHSHCHTVTGLV